MAFIDLGVRRNRIARMQIERRVETLTRSPERPVLRQIVVAHRVVVAHLGEAVDKRALEAELRAALELSDCQIGVLHWQSGKRAEAVWALGDFGRQDIVGPLRHFIGALDVGDRLHRRRVERQDHAFDSVAVHQIDAPPMQVQ
jgi:hypothetical protein